MASRCRSGIGARHDEVRTLAGMTIKIEWLLAALLLVELVEVVHHW